MAKSIHLKEIKFIADVMLGKLAKWLRTLGLDTLYYRDEKDNKLLALAVKENRQILTRKTSLKNRKDLKNQLLFIKANDPLKQLQEVIQHYNLKIQPPNLFTLCLICNQKLKEIPAEFVKDKVPDYVANTEKAFSTCPHCKRIFWQGTHHKNMWRIIEETLNSQ